MVANRANNMISREPSANPLACLSAVFVKPVIKRERITFQQRINNKTAY